MDSTQTCPSCGKPLAPTAPKGLCPNCLMQAGFATGTVSSNFIPPDVEELRPHFPQLEILEFLGRGGMGVVYKARQPKLNRLVALKILARDTASSPEFTERFQREAQALARLNHQNIVTVHDFGECGGFYYLLMEFVDGVNLRELLRSRKISADQALAIVPPICDALQFAHEQGIVHRDIKPENILLDKLGRVKIADFGIAKLIEPGPVATPSQSIAHSSESRPEERPRHADSLTENQILGTPNYMAPEQVKTPQEVDHRADIYSLGVVFYEMLTGELPSGIIQPPSNKVHIDVHLDEVVLHALEKEPERRYQQVSQMKTAIESIAKSAHEFPQHTSVEKTKPMNKKIFIGTLIGTVCLAALLAAVFLRPNAAAKSRVTTKLTTEGYELWQSQKLAEAEAKFKQAIEITPNDVNALNGLAWATFNQGKSAEAEKAFKKVVEIEPNHPAALNGLGQIYLSQANYDEAEKYLLKAAPQAPAAWYGLTRLYLIQEKFEQAEEYAQKLVDSGQADDIARKMLDAAKSKV